MKDIPGYEGLYAVTKDGRVWSHQRKDNFGREHMTKKTKAALVRKDGVFSCAMCGSQKIRTSAQEYKFPYGIGDNRVELSTKIPIRVCEDCGFTYKDSDANTKCHEAVCKHLNVITPNQVK